MLPDKIYHIYTHANGFENLFRTDENYRYFLKRYDDYVTGVAETMAYCLMPKHLHILVRIKTEAALKLFFKNKNLTGLQDLSGLTVLQFSHLLNAYTKAYNKIYNRKGSLFIRAFKRKEISSDSYFTSIVHYIHRNPLHHGFVRHISEWPWSSYNSFLLPELTAIQQEVIDWYGSRKQFIWFHQQYAISDQY